LATSEKMACDLEIDVNGEETFFVSKVQFCDNLYKFVLFCLFSEITNNYIKNGFCFYLVGIVALFLAI
jgi:hypothetical protein